MTQRHFEITLEIVGGLVFALGGSIVALYLFDHALARWLRFTNSMKLFVRFAWLDGKIKQQMRADLAYEERRQAAPYEPPPSAATAEAVLHSAWLEEMPESEDQCHPTPASVPLTTVEAPPTLAMEAAATVFEANPYSAPFGSDEGILDSDESEALGAESSTPEAPSAREAAEDALEACSMVLMKHMLEYGYMIPNQEMRALIQNDLKSLLNELKESTPRNIASRI